MSQVVKIVFWTITFLVIFGLIDVSMRISFLQKNLETKQQAVVESYLHQVIQVKDFGIDPRLEGVDQAAAQKLSFLELYDQFLLIKENDEAGRMEIIDQSMRLVVSDQPSVTTHPPLPLYISWQTHFDQYQKQVEDYQNWVRVFPINLVMALTSYEK